MNDTKWKKDKMKRNNEIKKRKTKKNIQIQQINSNCLIEIANGMKCANKNEITSREMPKNTNNPN